MTGPPGIVLPSLSPPDGVELRVGWAVAAMFWRAHTPAEVPDRCGRCQERWPCLSVRWADDFLNSTLSPDEPAALGVRETEPIPRP